MTRISYEIKKRFPELVMGILVNWDGVAGLSVADAVGADFVRVEHLFTGANVTSAGILQAQCVEFADLKKRTRSKVPIYARIVRTTMSSTNVKPCFFFSDFIIIVFSL